MICQTMFRFAVGVGGIRRYRYLYLLTVLGILHFFHVSIQVNHVRSSGIMCIGFRCCIGMC